MFLKHNPFTEVEDQPRKVLQKAAFKMMLVSETLLQGTFKESQQFWAMAIKMLLWKLNIKYIIAELIIMNTQKNYPKKSTPNEPLSFSKISHLYCNI